MATETKTLTFPRGGVHPPDSKKRTADLPLVASEPPALLEVLMLQHIRTPAAPLVKKEDRVRKGQLIGEAQGFISAHIHSPVSGTVKAVEARVHGPTGRRVPAVIIENDGEEEWVEGCNEPQDVDNMEPARMLERVQEAGVVGMGGATFPAHVKLTPPRGIKITDVIINGAECEPHLTCDQRLMIERTDEVLDALRLIMRIVGAEKGHIGIESNKPEAMRLFEEAVGDDPVISVRPLHVKFPQGAEQQIITAIVGREVPSGGGLPNDVSCLVHNVATALAIRDAVRMRRPLIERPLTLSGDGVENAGNFIERIGTSIQTLLERQGALEDANLLLLGGPMMGVAQAQFDVPVIKGTSGILLLRCDGVPPQRACIRCGRCVEHCPLGLMPGQLSIAAEGMNWDMAQRLGMIECKECGCCAYVCPANRRIVHLIRFGKGELAKRKRKQQQKT
ncbi:MAG: electron transport complex subunit RsxC [Candidatus Brocadiia bacterium]|jgi:electron transport complex protein RnfC|nr:electron transport complex subunit RsxC [Candidatus Brocadiia bacterium]